MNPKNLTTLSALLAAVALIVATFSFVKSQNLEKQLGGGTKTANAGNPSPAVKANPPATVLGAGDMAKLAEGGWVKGNQDAKVTMVEFSDFECPFCGRYASETYPQVDKNYIQTGKIRYVFQHFPLPFHLKAQKASEASECAGNQGKFWELHDKMFADQTKLAIEDLKKAAASLGLKTNQFNSCLDSGETKDKVEKGLSLGKSVGVQGTPAFFINGRLISGALPYANFQKVLDEELAK